MLEFIRKYFSARRNAPGFVEQKILHDGDRIKKTAQLWHVRHTHPENDGFNLELNNFEKPTGAAWPQELEPATKMFFKEDEVACIYEYLASNYASIGIRQSGNYAIFKLDEGFDSMPASQRIVVGKLIKSLLSSQSENALDELSRELEGEPNLLSKLKRYAQYKKYEQALIQLNALIADGRNEQAFKDWFRANPWIFGAEYLAREDISQIALRHRIDLCFTSADGYQDVIELKLPNVDLFREDVSHPVSYYLSQELSKAISQCSNYLYEIEEQRANIERNYGLPFLKPRARIIMGRSSAWGRDKNDALRKINSAFHNIDIMTYDHILSRANSMINYLKT